MIKFVAALLFLIPAPAMSCTWKCEITLYSGGKTWKEEIIASNRQTLKEQRWQRTLTPRSLAGILFAVSPSVEQSLFLIKDSL